MEKTEGETGKELPLRMKMAGAIPVLERSAELMLWFPVEGLEKFLRRS